jgi:16S rRNA (guanine1207-N2)-methyltransferase
MSAQALEALLLPFEEGQLRAPENGRGCLIRAEPCAALSGAWRDRVICEQTSKPEVDRLVAAGCQVVQRLSGSFDVGLCLLTKHKSESLANIARAWTLLEPGGVLVCSGAKNLGAAGVEKKVREAFGVEGSLAKFHCRVFWTTKPAAAPPPPLEWLELDELRPNVEETFLTRPGIFGWDSVDAGSRLLAENLPEDISGKVADLGAGWGYLSIRLLERFAAIQTVDLFEAELLALDAARANLAARGLESRADFCWHDVTAGLPGKRGHDWVVMNPPFHSGREADVRLGCAFITAAARALRPDGRLVMVANRHLPYEGHLERSFALSRILTGAGGFKILTAEQPR